VYGSPVLIELPVAMSTGSLGLTVILRPPSIASCGSIGTFMQF